MKLHLGCGQNYFDGYVNIDYPQSEHNHITPKCDMYADIKELSFDCGSIDEIRLHHVFEHFDRVTAIAMLIRWHQWLRIGGFVRIEVPDLLECSRMIVAGMFTDHVIRHMVGDQTAEWGYHVEQWTVNRLVGYLYKLGYRDITHRTWCWDRAPFLPNLEVVGVKVSDAIGQDLYNAGCDLLMLSKISESETKMYDLWCERLASMM